MANTIRRKHYVPRWVTTEAYSFIDPRTGVHVGWAGQIELQGAERAKQLRWWHEDKHCYWGARPPKSFRQQTEAHHRMNAKSELSRWRRNPDHDVLILCKEPLDYWD